MPIHLVENQPGGSAWARNGVHHYGHESFSRVGHTVRLSSRMDAYWRHADWRPCQVDLLFIGSRATMLAVERSLIYRLQPTENVPRPSRPPRDEWRARLALGNGGYSWVYDRKP